MDAAPTNGLLPRLLVRITDVQICDASMKAGECMVLLPRDHLSHSYCLFTLSGNPFALVALAVEMRDAVQWPSAIRVGQVLFVQIVAAKRCSFECIPVRNGRGGDSQT